MMVLDHAAARISNYSAIKGLALKANLADATTVNWQTLLPSAPCRPVFLGFPARNASPTISASPSRPAPTSTAGACDAVRRNALKALLQRLYQQVLPKVGVMRFQNQRGPSVEFAMADFRALIEFLGGKVPKSGRRIVGVRGSGTGVEAAYWGKAIACVFMVVTPVFTFWKGARI